MRILKGHILVLLFTAVISMLGIGGLIYLIGESWGWLPAIKPMISSGVDKNFFRSIAILFSFIGPFLFVLHWTDGEKYYETYSVDVEEFTSVEFKNTYMITLDNYAWYLNKFRQRNFVKKRGIDGAEINFTQYYDVNKKPFRLSIHI